MPRIAFEIESAVAPEDVLAAATDFGPRRPELWPLIDPAVFRVHGVGDGWADVTEGSAMLGGIWARERYDWTEPNVVRATIQDSNVYQPGGVWELRVAPLGTGSRVSVVNDRRPRGPRGYVLAAMVRLMGRRELPRTFQLTLDRLQSSPRSVPGDRVEVRP